MMLNKKRRYLIVILLASLLLAGVYLTRALEADGKLSALDGGGHGSPIAERPLQETSANPSSVTSETCFQLYDLGQIPEELELDRRYWLMGFFRQLERGDYSDTASFQVADLVGLTPAEFKSLSFGDVSLSGGIYMSNHVVADNFMERPSIGVREWSEIEGWVKDRNFSAITSAVEGGRLDTSSVLHGQSLLARAIAEQTDLNVQEVEQLLAVGFSLDLDAVITATRVGSSELAIYLAEHYQGDLATSWIERQTPMNLSLTAIAGLREDLFYFFINSGVTVFAFDSMLPTVNMLDVIPAPTSDDERDRAIRMVTEVLGFDLRPMRSSSVERLKSWLPDTVQETYQEQLQPLVELSSEVLEKADFLRMELAVFDAQITMSRQVHDACQRELEYDLEDYLTQLHERGDLVSERLSLATKKQVANFFRSSQENFFKRLETDPDFRAQLEAEGAVITIEERSEEMNERRRKMMFFKLDEDWDSGYQLCTSDAAGTQRSELCKDLLNAYLGSDGAEWNFVETILPYIDQLDQFTAYYAVQSGRLDLLQKLVALGMDVHSLNYRQETLLFDAINLGGKTATLKWLLDQGVPIKTEIPGLDALDVALAELDRYQLFMFDARAISTSHRYTALDDIQLLVAYGANIERSHREKLRQLMFSNPDIYQLLIAKIPELTLQETLPQSR